MNIMSHAFAIKALTICNTLVGHRPQIDMGICFLWGTCHECHVTWFLVGIDPK